MPEQPYNPADHPYPAHRYHAEHGEKLVKNVEEEQALGPGWFDSPDIHEKLLLTCGESSESKPQREVEIGQVREAFERRLERRASRRL